MAWLANTLDRFGDFLRAGRLVLPGAMCASVFADAGDMFQAHFPHLGEVAIRFG